MKTGICFYLILFSLVFFTGCSDLDYKKTGGGMPYKVFKSGSGRKIFNNSFLKINATITIEDSILFTTKDKIPAYLFVNPKSVPYDISEIWTSLEQGDSVVAIQMVDTFIQRNPEKVPPNFKRGGRIVSCIKVLDIFETDSAMTADETMENKKLMDNEVAFVTKYLEKRKIKAQKTPGGAFVEIINPGEGNLIDSGQQISVKYRGISFSGVTFDSNIDSGFGHTDPLVFIVGSGGMIKGLDEGMKYLRKGAVAKIYIPSMLAYGPSPSTNKIKPFENIMFEVTITEVKDKAVEKPGIIKTVSKN